MRLSRLIYVRLCLYILIQSTKTADQDLYDLDTQEDYDESSFLDLAPDRPLYSIPGRHLQNFAGCVHTDDCCQGILYKRLFRRFVEWSLSRHDEGAYEVPIESCYADTYSGPRDRKPYIIEFFCCVAHWVPLKLVPVRVSVPFKLSCKPLWAAHQASSWSKALQAHTNKAWCVHTSQGMIESKKLMLERQATQCIDHDFPLDIRQRAQILVDDLVGPRPILTEPPMQHPLRKNKPWLPKPRKESGTTPLSISYMAIEEFGPLHDTVSSIQKVWDTETLNAVADQRARHRACAWTFNPQASVLMFTVQPVADTTPPNAHQVFIDGGRHDPEQH